MASDLKSIENVLAKTAAETERAAGAVAGGCPVEEAVADFIRDGPADSLGEFNAVLRRAPGTFAPELACRIDQTNPQTRFRLVRASTPLRGLVLRRVLLPPRRNLIPATGQAIVESRDEALKSLQHRQADMDHLGEAAEFAVGLPEALNGSAKLIQGSKAPATMHMPVAMGLRYPELAAAITIAIVLAALGAQWFSRPTAR